MPIFNIARIKRSDNDFAAVTSPRKRAECYQETRYSAVDDGIGNGGNYYLRGFNG
jgi:hypothetical protein